MPESDPNATPPPGKDAKDDDDSDKLAEVQAEAEKWKALARKHESQSKSNADAAERLAALEDAKKSEADKAADRLASIESELSASRAEALRFKVATRHKISDEDAELFLTGTDEETLTKQAERLAGRTDTGKGSGNHVPGEGRTPKNQKTDDLREFSRNLFGRNS